MDSGIDDSGVDWSFLDNVSQYDPGNDVTDVANGSYDLGNGTGDWVPQTIDPITSDPSMGMLTPPDTGNYGMDPTFTDSSGNFNFASSSFGQAVNSAIQAAKNGNPSVLQRLGQLVPAFGQMLPFIQSALKTGVDAAQLVSYIGQSRQLSDAAKQYAQAGQTAANMADPFGSQRAQYAKMLSDSFTDPAKYLSTDPSYQFLAQQGLTGLTQQAAANGQLAYGVNGQPVGTFNKDMVDYSQGLASKTLNDERTQLASLSGSQFNPATAASLYMQGQQLQQQTQAQANANIGAAIRQGGQVVGDIVNQPTQAVAPSTMPQIPQPMPGPTMTSPPVDNTIPSTSTPDPYGSNNPYVPYGGGQ